tara:strand:- start:258 stop:1181 length:924 start_codon:yes stop_codon:yes gene_type:complete
MSNNYSDDQIDLRELILFFWEKKREIVLITTFFAIASIVITLMTPNEYRATISLVPNEKDDSSISNSLSGTLGGLSSIAGINFAAPITNEKTIAMERMQSWGFMESFINEYELEPFLAADGWNEKENEISIDNDLYDIENEEWKTDSDGNSYKPSSWESYQSLLGKVSLSEDIETGIIYFSLDYYSPKLATEWATNFIDYVNENMKERKLQQTTRNIQYLEAEIQKTSNAKLSEILYKLIENETKDKMLAGASPEYVFSTVSKAMIPERKVRPIRSKIVIISTLAGGVLSLVFHLIIFLFRQEKFRV